MPSVDRRPGNAMRRAALAAVVLGALTIAPVFALVAHADTPASPAEGWTTHSAPGNAQAISCLSPTFCEAVGAGAGKSFGVIYGARWDGSRWIRQKTPSPWDSELFGVSCVSTRFCIAVGQRNNSAAPLIESFNGTRWKLDKAPTQRAWHLDGGVSCVSSRFCIAVGHRNAPLGSNGVRTGSLVMNWNGARWARMNAPTKPADFPLGVSCVSSRFCVAAGMNNKRAVALHWNGRRWTRTTPPGSPGDFLAGVSCPSTRMCLAVGGRQFDHVLVDRWANGHWKREQPATNRGFLQEVDCPTEARCVAVGDGVDAASKSYPGLIEAWEADSGWTAGFLRVRSGFTGLLYGISCPSPVLCGAVGPSPLRSAWWRG